MNKLYNILQAIAKTILRKFNRAMEGKNVETILDLLCDSFFDDNDLSEIADHINERMT